MTYTSRYASPLGDIILACDEDALIGLWFNGQKYCGSTLPAGKNFIFGIIHIGIRFGVNTELAFQTVKHGHGRKTPLRK